MSLGQFVHFCRSIGNSSILDCLMSVPQSTLVGLPISLSLSVDGSSVDWSLTLLVGCFVGRFFGQCGSFLGRFLVPSVGPYVGLSFIWLVV